MFYISFEAFIQAFFVCSYFPPKDAAYLLFA